MKLTKWTKNFFVTAVVIKKTKLLEIFEFKKTSFFKHLKEQNGNYLKLFLNKEKKSYYFH